MGLEQLIEGRGSRLPGSVKRQWRGLCPREHQLHANWWRRVLAGEASSDGCLFEGGHLPLSSSLRAWCVGSEPGRRDGEVPIVFLPLVVDRKRSLEVILSRHQVAPIEGHQSQVSAIARDFGRCEVARELVAGF